MHQLGKRFISFGYKAHKPGPSELFFAPQSAADREAPVHSRSPLTPGWQAGRPPFFPLLVPGAHCRTAIPAGFPSEQEERTAHEKSNK
jgi:hypothetical protein